MPHELLKNWSSQDFEALEESVLVANHGFAETGYFTDEALAELLDQHPDDSLTISTMGSDPTRFEWIEGERNDVSGQTLIELVQQGRLWLNVRRALEHPHLSGLVDAMYDTLERRAPGFKAQDRNANLLISSSTAMVHYHIDMPVNMLWHIRGRKRVWVYPHFDHRFCSQVSTERVCVGDISEDVPYHSDLDRYALAFDVEPGQLITWPQFTPHRVQNLGGLCVSLSTEHKNPRARRRINMHQANHYLRHRWGWNPKSNDMDSFAAHAKQAVARGVRMAAKFSSQVSEQFVYPKSFVVDPSVEGGIRLLGGEPSIVAPHLDEELVAV